ncbi:hypothetical protein ACFLTX_00110 [Chloroflexota bacterium]
MPTPNLPQEFFSQVSDGNYEVRVDGVYAPDAKGEMRLWYETQPDGSWEEVYFRYGNVLTNEKKVELAEKLVCSRGPCIAPDTFGYPENVFKFRCISTGIIEKHAYIDPITGLDAGEQFDLVTVSRDSNNDPIMVSVAVQVELDSDPGINQFYGMVGYFRGDVWQQESKNIVSMEDLALLYRQGWQNELGVIFQKIIGPNIQKLNILVVYPNLDNPNYHQFINDFHTQGGFDTNEQAIFYSGYKR